MDKQTFYRWFRQTASNLHVPDVRLSFMSHTEARGELGRYEAGNDTVYIDDSQLQNDRMAFHTALHELAHAMVYRKNSEYLERDDGKIRFDPNNPFATQAIKKLEYRGGHNSSWRKIASSIGVNVAQYVDKDSSHQSPWEQIRFGIGFRR